MTKITLAERLERVPPYPFVVLAERVRHLQERGVDVIRMDIGAPDMPPPPHVVDSLIAAVRQPEMHGYPGYRGTPELKAAFASYYQDRFGVTLDPEQEVLPLIGSKEGLHHITLALVNPGDIVLVPDPGYPAYRASARLAGAEVVPMRLCRENGFLPDLDALSPSVLRRAKLLWLNYPNNPTGAVASYSFFEDVVRFAQKWGVLVCHDAPYTDVTFDGYTAPSLLAVPGAREIAVEFNSLSKAFNMAGWRVGVAVGCREAIAALLRMKSNVDTGIFLPLQHAAAVALRTTSREWIHARNAAYAHRRDIILDTLTRLGMEAHRPRGGLYIWTRVPSGYTGDTFAMYVLENAGVAFAPGSIYGQEGKYYVRISLGVPTERVQEAMRRLQNLTL